MIRLTNIASVAICSLIAAGTLHAVTYTETFNSLASGLPPGWTVSSNATATTIGNQNAAFAPAATAWSSLAGTFQNSASATGLASTATTAQQAASADRALALRQIGTFGDPGAAFNFNFSTTGATVSNISIDLMMLSVQTRSTTFTLQYGIGPNPTAFTTLGTYADPGTFGTTSISFTTADFGTNLDNQSNVFFRVVALTASTGTGSRDTVGIDNFSITTSVPIGVIPEPATYMLFGIGLLACAQRFRRSSKK
ncbi:MAG: PEP-CTERM sorting domain-containing protein [Chthoniobacterales bacterium]